jgi:hypothetical protein
MVMGVSMILDGELMLDVVVIGGGIVNDSGGGSGGVEGSADG